MYHNNCNIPAPEQLWLVVIMQYPNIEGKLNKKRPPPTCKWNEGRSCTRQLQHRRNGFCQFHYNIWSRWQRINNNEALTNTATGSGGAQLINHGTVGLTDNRLLSFTGDNDVSCVAHSNTSTGGGTLPINNEMLSRNENCLPSSNGNNEVSLEARGNTVRSKKKESDSALQMDRRV